MTRQDPLWFARLRRLVESAAPLAPEERAAFVEREAAGDQALVAEALALLEHHGAPMASFAQRIQQVVADEVAELEAPLPEQVGPFRVLRLLGAGGMGAVYLAEQGRPVERRVAVKVIRRGADHQGVLARFDLERQALAAMNHEAIATVYEAGSTATGQPYFVMEYIDGLPLCHYCDHHALSLVERVRLFQRVCAGVQHAHHKGVIHRDLKPTNILVTEVDGAPQPKIIDFGLARAADRQRVLRTLCTEQGTWIGTPEYMSPEQADSSGIDIDTRTDVYSLGVVLYELLSGTLPFPSERLRGGSWLEMQRIIQQEDAPRPSSRIGGGPGGRHTAMRDTSAPVLARALRGDLDWITLKALAKDRSRRYDSAAGLAADLQRFLDSEPVSAGPPTARYRLGKALRKYRAQFVAGGLLLLALLAGGVGTLVQWLRAERQASQNLILATEKGRVVHEFEQLAAVVRYERLSEAEQRLQPPWPHNLDAMRSWLARGCGPLLAMREEVEDTIKSLRASALPWTASQQQADRRRDPALHAEWLARGKLLESLRRAGRIRAGQQPDRFELSPEQRALDAVALNSWAWARVAPDVGTGARSVWDEEAAGLAAARLAVARAAGNDRLLGQCLDTLAWALVANGQDAAARQASADALQAAPAAEQAVFQGYLDAVTEATDRPDAVLARHERQYEELTARVTARHTYEFAPEHEAQEFLHDTLVGLLADLDVLEREQQPRIERQVEWAAQVRALTRDHPNARASWDDVRQLLASSDRYRGRGIELRDDDVLGLVPMGPNPVTGYLEFYHLLSAWDGAADPRSIPIPTHGEDGSVAVTGATGIVFVLLPGGSFVMGAQGQDPHGPSPDPQARIDEAPVEVTLEPFFLARHELTQGQWQRLWVWDRSLRLPSGFVPGEPNEGLPQGATLAHPVERVDWHMCNTLLTRSGLMLPTEAQWEYGCRAGSEGPFTCPVPELPRYANLADAAAKRVVSSWSCEIWDDGHVVHAPCGSFQANAFGLFDVHGNVWEWCRDLYGINGSERPGDGLRLQPDGSGNRVNRGGSWQNLAFYARAANRGNNPASVRTELVGVRAARALHPLAER